MGGLAADSGDPAMKSEVLLRAAVHGADLRSIVKQLAFFELLEVLIRLDVGANVTEVAWRAVNPARTRPAGSSRCSA